jgi:Fe2+ transport system protein FeoA
MTFSLDNAKPGSKLKIKNLPEGIIKSQLIRFGIYEGQIVHCIDRLVGGTIILQKSRQEIALGYDLARKILVLNEL